MPLLGEIQCLSAPPSLFLSVSSSPVSHSIFPSATLESADPSIVFNVYIIAHHAVKLSLYMFESPDIMISTAVCAQMQLLLTFIWVVFFN